ncbi:helix-turn-helix transcriptional regulator [Arthrobacter koreensis]|uniref:helix-turn-helix transcriptional regulator n=1 Tax=Arthrobacter koreensis TaxID=199136 RepID=UPI003821840E
MNQLMTPQQVGAEYGVTVQELAEWRRRNIGPDYYVLGTRVIRYTPEHVERWFRDPANSRWHDFPAEAFTEGLGENDADWLSVEVHRPLTWWRATPEQLGARVADPDHGAFPRWESYDQDWKAIGRTIQDVGDVLASGVSPAGPGPDGSIRIRVHDPGLSDLELKIVRSWFGPGEAVTMDPWDSGWSDGGHRTWHAAAASDAGVLLPIRGNILGFANAADIPLLGDNWSEQFRAGLQRLKQQTWVDQTDPVNRQFQESLVLAAAGRIPPVVPSAMAPARGSLPAYVEASFPSVLDGPSPQNAPYSAPCDSPVTRSYRGVSEGTGHDR